MKKKIYNYSLVMILIIMILFILTGCAKKENEKEKSEKAIDKAVESTINGIVDAVNSKDVSKVMDYIYFDSIETTFMEEVEKTNVENGLKDFFEQNETLNIEVEKIQRLQDDKAVLEDFYEYYDSYDEYVDEMEEEYGFDDISIYTAKLKVPDDYKDAFEDSSTDDGKDIVYLAKVDGKYKIIYTNFILSLYYDYTGEFDYDFDEEYDDEYDYEEEDEDYDYEEDYDDDEDEEDDDDIDSETDENADTE